MNLEEKAIVENVLASMPLREDDKSLLRITIECMYTSGYESGYKEGKTDGILESQEIAREMFVEGK